MADVDEDLHLGDSEVHAAVIRMTGHRRIRDAVPCQQVALASRTQVCFAQSQGADERLSRSEYGGPFLSCMLRAPFPAACGLLMCRDV